MYEIIIYLLISFRRNPSVGTVKNNKTSTKVEILYKDKKCGYIYIRKDNLTFYLSFGIKSCKGVIGIEYANLYFEENILFLKSDNKPDKILMKLNCSKSNYELIKKLIDRLKKERNNST